MNSGDVPPYADSGIIMRPLKSIGAPGSFKWLEQVLSREGVYDLLGASMLAVGLNPTEEQTLKIADDLIFKLWLEIGT